MGLGIDLGVLVAQLVDFFLLLGVLTLVLYRPMRRVLKERSERIAKGLADAEMAAKRAAQAEADYQQHIQEARRMAQDIVAQAKKDAEQQRESILSRAQSEAQEIRARASGEVQQQQREALTALQGQITDLALEAAAKVLGQTVDDRAHRQLVQEFITQLEQGR